MFFDLNLIFAFEEYETFSLVLPNLIFFEKQ
jgi:hypothetical protein